MKKTLQNVAAFIALLAPTSIWAQNVQPIPDRVNVVEVADMQRLRVEPGEESRLETSLNQTNVAQINGTHLVLNVESDSITLRLAPGRSIAVRATDFARVYFYGSFQQESLEVNAEDYSIVTFDGTTADTVRCKYLTLKAEDFSRIYGNSILQTPHINFSALDFGRIVLEGVDDNSQRTGEMLSKNIFVSDYAMKRMGRCTANGELIEEDYPTRDNFIDGTIDLANQMIDGLAESTYKKKNKRWTSGDFDLTFSWGWHNWGRSMYDGFGGTTGASRVNTSFNNIYLAGCWELIGSRYFGVELGIGLEWDKWKFYNPDVTLSIATVPYQFVAGPQNGNSTMLTTRYVEMPLAVRIGKKSGLSMRLSVLPGIHWDASGMRYKINGFSSKDQTINQYINPYKLDLRAELTFDWIGVFVQVSTMPAFRDSVEPLYPIKFGIII